MPGDERAGGSREQGTPADPEVLGHRGSFKIRRGFPLPGNAAAAGHENGASDARCAFPALSILNNQTRRIPSSRRIEPIRLFTEVNLGPQTLHSLEEVR
ncbi:hypothetical protein GCM10022267_36450 [Lentzea roselyniae]|uniref:Uncharacterized protein n=1 Tax=Lentzea roselyniae TaxID=531940 RepID=A0ABP7B2X1_9PSEU